MEVIINNPSNPGAHLTQNTIRMLEALYVFCEQHPDERINVQEKMADAGFNPNNVRNVLPLMGHLHFVEYSQLKNVNTSSLFTDRGCAYMETVLLEQEGECSTEIIQDLQELRKSLIKGGLNYLLQDKSCRYWIYRRTLEYLLRFSMIDIKEFAYLIYAEKHGILISSGDFSTTIEEYRQKAITIDTVVEVTDKKNSTRKTKKTGDNNLVAFSYVTGLIIESGIAEIQNDYCILNEAAKDDLESILRGEYDEKSR